MEMQFNAWQLQYALADKEKAWQALEAQVPAEQFIRWCV
jgi:hypothetical protein